MIKTTKWRPDTCECVIEYTWDDSVSAEERVHIHKSIEKCKFHFSIIDDVEAHEKVKTENQTKNKIHGHILENFPEVVDIVMDSNTGKMSKQFKPGVKYEWSFNNDRELIMELTGVTKKISDDVKLSVDKVLNEMKSNIK